MAPQFGQAIGQPDGLRNALGYTDAKGTWHPRRPDPKLYETEVEPHARGDLLVGAVFEAFKKIYESRVADLRRIATHGTGVLPIGYLHPDLINRFTQEAAKSARHVLDMCMRALDYMPPVEANFGDFLRAIVTADADLVPNDHRRYRVAFVDAFRSYGIGPAGIGTLSVDTVRWTTPPATKGIAAVSDFVKVLADAQSYWNIPREREALWHALEAWRHALEDCLKKKGATAKKLGVIDLTLPFEVVSFDLRERAALTGDFSLQWVIKIVQQDNGHAAGCTLLVDAETGNVRYQIEKATGARKRKTDLLKRSGSAVTPLPRERRLRVFAFDPSMGVQLATAGINEVTIAVPWERDDKGKDILQPGPVGEYLEVIDHDPASGGFYAPVDLNDTRSSRRTACRRRRATRSSTSRWSTRWRCARSATSSARSAGWRSGRRHRTTDARRPSSRNTSRGCGSIRTRCARRTPTTARRRRRCSSATSRRRSERTEPAPRR